MLPLTLDERRSTSDPENGVRRVTIILYTRRRTCMYVCVNIYIYIIACALTTNNNVCSLQKKYTHDELFYTHNSSESFGARPPSINPFTPPSIH